MEIDAPWLILKILRLGKPDYNLIENSDYQKLVKLRENYFKKNPDDIYAHVRLGEAYVMNKEYEKALKTMGPFHVREPDFRDVHHVILDALFEQGKDVDDFDWVQRPEVINIQEGKRILTEKLKNKRKHSPFYEMYIHLMSTGYLKFTEQMLLDALCSDDRFNVKGDKNAYYDCSVKLRK